MNAALKLVLRIVLTFIISMAVANAAGAERQLGWVGLWNEAMLEWAENKNRISGLCPNTLPAGEQSSCQKRILGSKLWSLGTYAHPDTQSAVTGEIIIHVKPGTPFHASFKAANGEQLTFTPDLFDQDWGYGPYFHQTLLEQQGEWLKVALPGKRPPAWINPVVDIQKLDVIPIMQGQVYRFVSESIVIVEIGKKSLSYRLENEVDMWCEHTERPEVPAGDVRTIGVDELFDDGHLKLDLKYKRGC